MCLLSSLYDNQAKNGLLIFGKNYKNAIPHKKPQIQIAKKVLPVPSPKGRNLQQIQVSSEQLADLGNRICGTC
jgi:hypothetical protein